MEPEVLKSLAALIISIFIPSALAVFSLRYPPSWLEKGPLAPFWTKINLISLSAASVASLLAFILYSNHSLEFRFVATFSSGILTFIFGQTLFTDFAQRLADRRVMFMANLASLAAGYWFLSRYDPQNLVIYIVFAIIATATIFMPQWGDSDGRAFLLVILSAFPVLGTFGLQWGIIGFLVSLLIYVVSMGVRNKNFKTMFLAKLSIPLVPILIAPFPILVILNSVIPIR